MLSRNLCHHDPCILFAPALAAGGSLSTRMIIFSPGFTTPKRSLSSFSLPSSVLRASIDFESASWRVWRVARSARDFSASALLFSYFMYMPQTPRETRTMTTIKKAIA